MYRSLLFLLPAVALAASACTDDDAQVVSATTTPASSPMADTSWTLAVLSSDGMTLEITVGIQPAGEGPCEQQFRYEVTETEHAVTVAFAEVKQTTTTTEPVACEEVLQPQSFEIELDSPLGDRALYDGVQPQPRQVWRLAEVVVPTVLPDGVTADDLGRSPGTDFGPVHWTQHAVVPSGPGWDLLIDQGRAGSFATVGRRHRHDRDPRQRGHNLRVLQSHRPHGAVDRGRAGHHGPRRGSYGEHV